MNNAKKIYEEQKKSHKERTDGMARMVTAGMVTRTRRARTYTTTRAALGWTTSHFCSLDTDLGNGKPLHIVLPKDGDYTTIVYRQASKLQPINAKRIDITLIVTD